MLVVMDQRTVVHVEVDGRGQGKVSVYARTPPANLSGGATWWQWTPNINFDGNNYY